MIDKLTNLIGIVAMILMIIALYMVFLYAPTEKDMGNVQRIFYFHVSFAWSSFIAFFVTFAASIIYLFKKNRVWDTIASSSVEIGIAFCCIILTTGPIWARQAWGSI